MKKFKFRVWDKIKSRFLASYNNEGLRFDPNTPSKEGEDFGFGSLRLDFFIENEQNRYVVQQFTGLVDKNGKEIYEGDILLVKGYDDWFDADGHDYKLTVKWKSEENGDVSESCGYLYIPTEREVVGNIFENENI